MSKYYNIKTSIIIVNYNTCNDSIECIESILKDKIYNNNIIIVDNNSTDNSNNYIIARLRSFGERFKCPYTIAEYLDSVIVIKEITHKGKPGITFISSNQNKGFAYGNNIGIKFALEYQNPDYIWLLNNDTTINSNTLSALLNTFQAYSDVGMAGSKILFYDNHTVVQSLGNENVSWKGVGKGNYDNVLNNDLLPKASSVKSILGASIMIKREVIDVIGMMDEAYFMQHEETDWCLRCLNAGYSLIVNSESVVFHKEGKSTGRRRIYKNLFGKQYSRTNIYDFLMWGYYSFRNEIFLIKKFYKKTFLLYVLFRLPVKYARHVVSIFVFNDDCKLKRLLLIHKAIYDGFCGNMGKTIDPIYWKSITSQIKNKKY